MCLAISKAVRDLTGQRFGRLVVECFVPNENRRAFWKCRCDCGKSTVVCGHALVQGGTKSCGCWKIDQDRNKDLKNRSHGLCSTHPRLLRSIKHHWEIISDSTNNQYPYYKDVKIPTEYLREDGTMDFVKFCHRLIELHPVECEEYEKDREMNIDKDILNEGCAERVFSPERIKFVTAMSNNHNRRNTIKLENGLVLSDVCKSIGMTVCVNGRCTKEYKRVDHFYRKYGHLPKDVVEALDKIKGVQDASQE